MNENMQMKNQKKETPSTVTQLANAMAALGMYAGENSEAEHTAEAKRLGSADYYRMLLVNALLGMVETDAMLADSGHVSHEQMLSAHRQARVSAGAEETPGKLLGFLRWQTLRVEGPLREMAQDVETGPIPLAAAHAAEGLQLLLGVCMQGQDLENASPTALTKDLKIARESLTNAVANIDIMLQLVAQTDDLFSL
jgi:Family of unknown function (DUF6245)